MVYKVALVGHSQLPYIEDYDDVEFERFKRGGARIETFTKGNDFSRICSDEWDCVIIFLGGNDLCDHHDASLMVRDLLDFVSKIQAQTIFVTEVEKRFYKRNLEIQYNTTTQQYTGLANTANHQLRRRAKAKTFRLIHLPSSYNLNSRDGGIHFGDLAVRSLISKYIGNINRVRNE